MEITHMKHMQAICLHIVMVMHLCLSETLDCFNCQRIHNLNDCHVTTQCTESQMCHTEYYYEGGIKYYSLGCQERVLCVGLDMTHLFGREADDRCEQCCSIHGCNKYLCPLTFTAAPPPVDGEWSSWGPWAGCSSSCGIGLTNRYRKCDNPSPTSNGRLCLGDAKDVQLCNKPCTDLTTTADPPVKPTITLPLDSNTINNPYVTNDLTQAPGECRDLIDCGNYYRPKSCHPPYLQWAQRFCPFHCGFCPSSTAPPCLDLISNCAEYQGDMCSNELFWRWREDNCKKFCKLC